MRPGSGPPPMTKTRPAKAAIPMPWRGVAEVVEANPAPVGDAVGEDFGDGARRLLAARRHDVTEKSCCAGSTPRIGYRREPRPALRARSVRLEIQEVGVEPGRSAADRVHGPPERGHAQMLARRRPDHDRPALRAKIERERISRQPAGGGDASCDDDLPSGHACAGGGTWERQAGQRAPAPGLEDERAAERHPGLRVAAEHVWLTAGTDGHRVMNPDRQVGQPAPAVPGRRVRVDARCRASLERQASEDDDLVPDGRGDDLGTWKRHRRPSLPGIRTSRRQRNEHECESNAEDAHAVRVVTPDRRRA